MTSDPLRGVIFDLDGTLIDSYDAIADSLNHALAHFGEPALPVGQVRRMVGHGLECLVEEALGADRVVEGVRRFRRRYADVAPDTTRVLPGVAETLATLHARGYRMGVASNKPASFSGPLLEQLKLAPYLEGVLGPDLVAHPKPHPEMVRTLLGRLGIHRGQGVYVGDMEIDVETARNAGMPCWLIATGSRTAEELAGAGGDRLLGRFEDLLELLPDVSPG